jgi:hypothetical protein
VSKQFWKMASCENTGSVNYKPTLVGCLSPAEFCDPCAVGNERFGVRRARGKTSGFMCFCACLNKMLRLICVCVCMSVFECRACNMNAYYIHLLHYINSSVFASDRQPEVTQKTLCSSA